MAVQTPLCSERCVCVYKELGDSLISWGLFLQSTDKEEVNW